MGEKKKEKENGEGKRGEGNRGMEEKIQKRHIRNKPRTKPLNQTRGFSESSANFA